MQLLQHHDTPRRVYPHTPQVARLSDSMAVSTARLELLTVQCGLLLPVVSSHHAQH